MRNWKSLRFAVERFAKPANGKIHVGLASAGCA
jgi:hypothetical protein